MKNISILRFFISLLVSCSFFLNSCDETGKLPVDNTVPMFPEDVIVRNVSAGDVVSLHFDANMKWRISLSGAGCGAAFWINDDDVKAGIWKSRCANCYDRFR